MLNCPWAIECRKERLTNKRTRCKQSWATLRRWAHVLPWAPLGRALSTRSSISILSRLCISRVRSVLRTQRLSHALQRYRSQRYRCLGPTQEGSSHAERAQHKLRDFCRSAMAPKARKANDTPNARAAIWRATLAAVGTDSSLMRLVQALDEIV